ncbi:4a-hydroxytetrahydrobiopterin dehydratase [Variovorax sp. J31P179]|uniref:4a-hydroxytetrahydrobiopterin dehydratase n=1 Tax=Variovorax sp. J31P179 TaxID=3053508 RepID=UPI002576D4A1|nr:4a-hydroxytetrahydrobiopterin dehydratase [Variovorax sp. J31P179]MDM0084568.1 4a-hydroxytetrahydrobiopterin dehydratase [Variovorax sp. J31P179]
MSDHLADIFISYRRLDSAIFAQWLANQLKGAYGPDCVFIDTESIRDADLWATKIHGALKVASIVVVVIGKNWLSIKDEFERRRIDHPDDWVRREIEVSLEDGKSIIPLLIDGADMPIKEALPSSVAGLLAVQSRSIQTTNIAADISSLVADLGIRLGKTPATAHVNYPFPLLKVKALDSSNLARLAVKLPEWRIVHRATEKGEKTELMRTYEFESFEDAIHFMNTAVRFIARIDHHPEWTNIWRTLIVYLTTWDIGHRPSLLDVDVAAYLDGLFLTNYERKLSRRDLDAAGNS